jgi:hypothetical protein
MIRFFTLLLFLFAFIPVFAEPPVPVFLDN